MKRKWIFLSLATVLLLTAVTVGSVLAWGGGGGNGEGAPKTDFAARVAQILELDEGTVQDAFDQAKQDIVAERIEVKLQWAIEQEFITEEKADEIREQIEAGEADPFWTGHGHRHGKGFRFHHKGPRPPATNSIPEESS